MAQIGITPIAATIAAGQSLSGATPLGVGRAYGIVVPSGWTGASMTFQVSPDGGTTWYELYDGAGNEVTLTVAGSQYIAFNQATIALVAAINMIKIRSGTAGSPVTQTGVANLTITTQVF